MTRNFATVPLSEVLEKGLLPHGPTAAPYLLVVDDECVVADNFASILRRAGYAVSVAYDGPSAIQFAQLAPPELVLTDFRMPGMHGVALALCLRELIPACKVLFITASPEDVASLLAERCAGHHYPILAKPLSPPDLLQCIVETLACSQPNSPRACDLIARDATSMKEHRDT